MSSVIGSGPEVRMIELKQIEGVLCCSEMLHGFGYKCGVDPGDGIDAGSALTKDIGLRP